MEPNRLSSFARNCVFSANTTNTKPQQCNPLPSQPCLGGTIPPAQVLMQFKRILKAKRSFGLFFSPNLQNLIRMDEISRVIHRIIFCHCYRMLARCKSLKSAKILPVSSREQCCSCSCYAISANKCNSEYKPCLA